MNRPKTIVSTGLMALWMASFALLAGCGAGNNETPAAFDPAELALVRVEPADGESSVARNRPIRLTFNTTVLPSSVHDQSLKVRTGGTFQTRPKGAFLIAGNIVEFEPTVTDTGGANSAGYPAGAQILVEVPLKILGDFESANNF
ncbi:MAG: Ig-like domain-containing domain, partial [Planctomycetota bacterium]